MLPFIKTPNLHTPEIYPWIWALYLQWNPNASVCLDGEDLYKNNVQLPVLKTV